jgi:hypothetical protein
MNRETVWLAIGFLGQGLFFMRFFVQWLASERKGKSHIPISFWYFSLGGSMILLTYAIYRLDPVFICGQLWDTRLRPQPAVDRPRQGAPGSEELSGMNFTKRGPALWTGVVGRCV